MAVWYEWNTDTSASTTAAEDVWDAWNSTTPSIATASGVWVKWNISATAATSTAVVRAHVAPAITDEEQQKLAAERAALEEKWRLEREERERQRKAADERAETLLKSCLTQRQRRQYRKTRAFHVRARDGSRFRLSRGWAGNVVELNGAGRPVARLCIHPREFVPEADNLLAQKLLLETDPDCFRRVANRTPIAP